MMCRFTLTHWNQHQQDYISNGTMYHYKPEWLTPSINTLLDKQFQLWTNYTQILYGCNTQE